MTSTSQAIERAVKLAIVEGGYRGDYNIEINNGEIFTFGKRIDTNEIFLDPKFWQALSRAEGWNQGLIKGYYSYEWIDKMHSFIDALIEGRTAEEFFADLLTKSQ